MKTQQIYNFFFHPLNDSHSDEVKVFSVITNIALSILTAGTYLLLFGLIQWKDWKKTHSLNKLENSPTEAVQLVIGKDPSLAPVVSISGKSSSVPGFVGIAALKEKQKDHLFKLKALAYAGQWEHLREHTSHPDSGFDWWMFPINRSSAGQGTKYQLSLSNIEELKKDSDFMSHYREGVKLIMLSWGWDADSGNDVSNASQCWTNYEVRLGKMAHSLLLFDQQDLLKSLKQFCVQKGFYSTLSSWIQKYFS